ncbi:MAG: hypothetical protein HYZ53_01555 [Planctomycetes bacterium]|nr:hypothetical protein [Planctomycetota bacterium]
MLTDNCQDERVSFLTVNFDRDQLLRALQTHWEAEGESIMDMRNRLHLLDGMPLQEVAVVFLANFDGLNCRGISGMLLRQWRESGCGYFS